MTTVDLDLLRARNPIADVVQEHFQLRPSGTHFIGIEHDSFVVNPSTGWYHWNSRDERGDVIDFTGRYLLNYGDHWQARDPEMFKATIAHLAERAGIPLPATNGTDQTAYWSKRDLIDRLHSALLNHPQALAYATQTRGWDRETIALEQLGYMPRDKKSLLKGLDLPDKWQAVINRFPAEMLVYIHLEKGQLTYLSGRSIQEKRHYNPPRAIIGARCPYANRCYHSEVEQVVVVEGQADALTFSQWGVPAIALAGMSSSTELVEQLQGHRRVFVALDNTEAVREKALELARAIGPRACLPALPVAIKDANEWLTKQQATAEQVQTVLNLAQPLIEAEIAHVEGLVGLARQDAIDALLSRAATWPHAEQTRLKRMMKGRLDVSCTYFNDMLKHHTQHLSQNEDDEEILNDDIPLIAPALGFLDEMALVTVSLMERTRDNRLNIQPYLVTSQRELRRLGKEQIVPLGGREVALKTIPEGTEFLMRWRYRDIQRFLDGETVAPGEAFRAVHQLYETYIDFTTAVDSQVVALWVIGTYFYTMFRAYPYLALNGPKNSGKSTVLTVTKPLAFNMVTTSDLTGPSLFRLIHQNRCAVGIDEAERYHKPRDPEMQQIRQLLNSGYKPGMPAIRLTGDDHTPQAFDVYSPKMLANIRGLEDVLASRCIAIPMRRTARKLPAFPPAYDGAAIRHMLYTLALTHHGAVHHNYYARPELHTLTNRSDELWSPLVALAAFFEEVGQIEGLVDAIHTAAERDVALSDGKALSPREEAVLQALEVISRPLNLPRTWIKAAELRQQVAALLGLPVETLGSAPWIGQIMKRLQLTDRRRRKTHTGGKMYLIEREQVLDMMRRYDVDAVEEEADG